MTTYRLPDGIEVKATNNGEVTGAGVWVEHPVYGSIAVERDKLTEVKPPLPPEPAVGEFVACGTDGNLLPIYRRWDEGWANVDSKNDDGSADWEGLCAYSQERAGRYPLRLVPDPADDAPELPWRDSGDTIEVADPAANDDTPLWVHIKSNWRSTAEARRLAALLLRAAREVEQR